MQIQNPAFQPDTSPRADSYNPNVALLDSTESQPDPMCQRVTRFFCTTLSSTNRGSLFWSWEGQFTPPFFMP